MLKDRSQPLILFFSPNDCEPHLKPILILWEREFRSREVKLQSSHGGRAASRPSYRLQATSYKCPQPASTQCPMSIHCQSPQTTLRSNFNRWGTRLAHLRELLSWATMRVCISWLKLEYFDEMNTGAEACKQKFPVHQPHISNRKSSQEKNAIAFCFYVLLFLAPSRALYATMCHCSPRGYYLLAPIGALYAMVC